MNKLTYSEQEALFAVHREIFGSVISERLRSSIRNYNLDTLLATEQILDELRVCNSNIQTLIVAIVGGSAIATKGWLRATLEKIADELGKDHVVLNGAGCRNVAAASWIRVIQLSTFE